MLRGKSKYGLGYVVLSILFMGYLSFEMGDGGLIGNFFSRLALSPLLYMMFSNLIMGLIGYLGNSRFLFVFVIINLFLNALLYLSNYWFVLFGLIAFACLAFVDIKRIKQQEREVRDYFIVNAYLKEKNIDDLDDVLVKRLAKDYNGGLESE